jgi:hypothetical protein
MVVFGVRHQIPVGFDNFVVFVILPSNPPLYYFGFTDLLTVQTSFTESAGTRAANTLRGSGRGPAAITSEE